MEYDFNLFIIYFIILKWDKYIPKTIKYILDEYNCFHLIIIFFIYK